MTEHSLSPEIEAARAVHKTRGAEIAARISQLARILFFGVLIALGLRSLAYEPFNIPSESMQPGLLVGDYLFVAKFPYGFSRYSFPLALPLFEGRVLARAPQRGDVAVFKSPADNRTDFIKRIIGLPGDRVRMTQGQLELNGVRVPRLRIGDFVTDSRIDGGCNSLARPAQPARGDCRFPQYRETLPSGRSYMVLDEIAQDVRDDTPLVTVPAGHYFVLGDNRDDSADSRLTVAEGGVGMVPAENLVGRADRIFFSVDNGDTRAPHRSMIRFGRIGQAL